MNNITKKSCNLQRRIVTRIVVDVIIWFSVAVPVLCLFLHGSPYERGFFCDEVALSYPYRPESLSTHLLLATGFTISIIVVVVTEVLNCTDLKWRKQCVMLESTAYCLKGYAVFLVGFILQQLVVEVVKNKTGVLRPNFIDVCKPMFDRASCPGYISNYTCTGNNFKEVRESRLSFPSGHSSFSMYIAVYFCMYIEDRLQIDFSYILKLCIQSGLVFLALLCGLDRVLDNKHHPSDVVVGFLLGVIVAVFVYNKVGRNILNCTSAASTDQFTLQTNQGSCTCCRSDTELNELEAQTPAPLLQNEYPCSLNSGNNNSKTLLTLKDVPLHVRRHFSTPITPTRRFEEIV